MRLTHAQQEEFYQLKKDKATIDRAVSRLLAFEAAFRVIARNGLLDEFARELDSLTNGE